ncbi:MAG: TRAP transporter substrate-binding protein [Rhodospirillales bacterium]|nr:TRAP transporter substrate-binding protein [Rhodospirillales bacterium]
MKRHVISVTLAAACAALMGTAGTAPAAAADAYVFKFAHAQPLTSVRHKSMELFKEDLEKATSGRIKVELFGAGVLGNESELMDMVKVGNLQGTRGSQFAKANPKFLIYTLPFLFQDTDSVLAAMRGPVGQRIAAASKANGFHIPATGVAGGFRQFTTDKRPIETVDDVKGLKLRTPPIDSIVQTIKALDASPQSVPYGETYMALKTGVVDGQENPCSNIVEMKFYEVQKYMSLVNYQIHPDPLFVSLKWYEGLPADLKAAFDASSRKAMEWSDTHWLASETDYLKTLEGKLKVNAITAQNRANFVAKVKPVWTHYVQQGAFSEAEINEVLAAAKKK